MKPRKWLTWSIGRLPVIEYKTETTENVPGANRLFRRKKENEKRKTEVRQSDNDDLWPGIGGEHEERSVEMAHSS